ncbi:MAG TPA: DUF2314 domain-containing protein [Verrucomicrobiae bacterium]
MFAWLQKNVPFYGSALFHGTWPLRKDGFDHLRARGIELTELPPNDTAHWALELKHPEWGVATLMSSRNLPPPPSEFVDMDATLNPDEAEEIKRCGSMVQLIMESRKNNILRDRKNALFFLNAILGDDGVAAMDHVGLKIWSREALAIETAHSADLDVDGIMTYHLVTDDQGERGVWLHSHGLGEIGFYDFDVLNPHEDINQHAQDVLRCLAFRSLEGDLKPGATVSVFASGEMRCVSAGDFMAKASAADRALRDDANGDHAENRVVLCNAKTGVLGLFGSKPHPAKILSEPYDERNLIHFSTEATELMSLRARSSFELFTKLVEEFTTIKNDLPKFEFMPAVKIGYATDDAKKESDREHMWFHFHEVRDGQIDATLLNQPFHIARLKEGDRSLHSLDLLTDWTIFNPAGPITPSNSRPLRFIRKNMDKLRDALNAPETETV